MKLIGVLLTSCLLTSCAGLLPTSKEAVNNRWLSFDDVKNSFDQIIPYSTNMDSVRNLGFDPYKTPNMQILNYSQVVRAVLPSPLQDPSSIPTGLLDCMKVQEGCVGYFMEPGSINRQRDGNFFLDFMNFQRSTRISGWKFGALIVVIDNMVVYKQWSGRPRIEETEFRRNPLGPLQDAGGSLIKLP